MSKGLKNDPYIYLLVTHNFNILYYTKQIYNWSRRIKRMELLMTKITSEFV